MMLIAQVVGKKRDCPLTKDNYCKKYSRRERSKNEGERGEKRICTNFHLPIDLQYAFSKADPANLTSIGCATI